MVMVRHEVYNHGDGTTWCTIMVMVRHEVYNHGDGTT